MTPSTNPKDRIGRTKPPLHLIPPAAMIEEAVVMGLGADKYGPYNWRHHTGSANVYVAACYRHIAQWYDGQDDDPESGASHLAHARACLGILLDAKATGMLLDDRPPKGAAERLIREHTKGVDSATEAGYNSTPPLETQMAEAHAEIEQSESLTREPGTETEARFVNSQTQPPHRVNDLPRGHHGDCHVR